jgi:cytochrome c peroxidase
MTLNVGDKLPDVTFPMMGAEGPEALTLFDRLAGRKVVIFALPGAFSRTCDAAHMPSFIRTKDAFAAKGVDEIMCLSVNDPFVMKAWGATTGADGAGITMIADAEGAFTKAVGMEFDAPVVGFYGRSKRYAMVVEDGVVTHLNIEPELGCTISGGEALLEAMG